MKNGISRLSTVSGLMIFSSVVYGQGAQSASNFYTNLLIGVLGFVVIAVLLQLTDNLLLIEAKKTGADKTGRNFSIFPVAHTRARQRNNLPRYSYLKIETGTWSTET